MAFGRRRGFNRRRSRASVAWIPGVTGYDVPAGTPSKLLAFSPVVTGVNTWGAAINLTNNTDLSLHGGEDAVFMRARGRLLFWNGQLDGGAGFAAASFPLRVVIVQTDTNDAGTIMPFDFTTSEGLGRDDILFSAEQIVSSANTFNDSNPMTSSQYTAWVDIDCKAKRRIQTDRHIIMWMQTVAAAGTLALQCRFSGGLRMLLKRPR